MVGNKQVDAGGGKVDGGNAGAGNPGPDPLAGRSDPADADTGQSQQSAQGDSSSGHYTGGPGAGSTRESGIVSAPPESNVGPPGAPQSSRGSATEPVPGGTAGTASEQGGGEQGMGAAAAGGDPGTQANMPDPGSQAGATDAAVAGSAVEDLARESPDRPGGGDTR